MQETKVIYLQAEHTFCPKLLVGSSETTREAPSIVNFFLIMVDEDIVRPGRKLPLHWSLITNYVGLKENITFNR
ncbi:MAG: hypothetical protein EOP34_01710 [Rickettsiales bacterium]|nr:MAG: hypothetical protein EOP34_01710 [Rickettsiales bacterium]